MSGPRSAVVVNPTKVADADALRGEVTRLLSAAGWPAPDWLPTTADDPGTGQARQAVTDGAEVLFACGGDGTVRACLSVLAGTDTALAVLPAGTGNLLAGNLGVPDDVAGAVAVATTGRRRRIDVGRIDGERFAVAAGLGFDADLLADAPEPLKRRVGWLAYLVSAARHLHDPRFAVELRLDGDAPRRHRARTVVVANVSELRGGLAVAPDARPDDGRLDVTVVAPRRLGDWCGVVYRTLRRQPHDQVTRYRAGTVDVRVLGDPVARQLDGDAVTPGDRLRVDVEPGALEVCCR